MMTFRQPKIWTDRFDLVFVYHEGRTIPMMANRTKDFIIKFTSKVLLCIKLTISTACRHKKKIKKPLTTFNNEKILVCTIPLSYTISLYPCKDYDA